jgi:hypothetical protein
MYTPQFSDSASISIRRLAWALNVNMPAAVNRLIRLLPSLYEPGLICQCCKDQSRCSLCAFSKQITKNDIEELLTL